MIPGNSVWLITGCSKGLGRAIAEQALAAGYRVVATARRSEDVADLASADPDRALALALDVTEPATVAASVKAAEERFGGIDVLVNNAGYGYMATIEEGDDADMRALFDTDVFGAVATIKAVLPGMRKRRRGHVVNISSIGGLITYPGMGYYHMAKFAIEALSDALAKEVAPLGIKVTVVAPGSFRTDFRGSLKQSATVIDDYASTAGKLRTWTQAGHGMQPGDPVRGARAIITAVQAETPPVHLLIGSDALEQYRARLADAAHEVDAWEELTRGTDFAADVG